jgi:hypothetical protein
MDGISEKKGRGRLARSTVAAASCRKPIHQWSASSFDTRCWAFDVRCSTFLPPSLTVASLGKAAAALGQKVEVRFVPA